MHGFVNACNKFAKSELNWRRNYWIIKFAFLVLLSDCPVILTFQLSGLVFTFQQPGSFDTEVAIMQNLKDPVSIVSEEKSTEWQTSHVSVETNTAIT